MIFKTRHFARWARKAGLVDSLLKAAIIEIQGGLLETDLGGGIVKKRIALRSNKCTDCGCHRKKFFDGGRA
jgi:hypothetical protein